MDSLSVFPGASLIGAFIALICTLAFILPLWERNIHFTDELNWAGLRKESFRTVRASFRQLLNSAITLKEGYSKVIPPALRQSDEAS